MEEVTNIKPQVTALTTPDRVSGPAVEQTHAPAPSATTEPPQPVQTEAVAQELREYASQHDIHLNFSVHEATGRTVIKVIDAETREVVREIPPEEILKLIVSIEEMAGSLLDTKA